MNIKNIINEAYQLYMPQVRSEITELSKFVIENTPLKEGKPINILEIGTKFGGTFYIWNKINPNGMNISIDMSDGGLHGGISESEMDQRNLWFNERFDNCHFIRGDSHEVTTSNQLFYLLHKRDILKVYGDEEVDINKMFISPTSITDMTPIDFLFIDGDHTFHGVEQDWEMYSPLVKKGGVIAFHDIIISNQHHERNVYVGEFWRELIRVRNSENPNQCLIDGIWYKIYEFIENQEQNWAGIGVLIKI